MLTRERQSIIQSRLDLAGKVVAAELSAEFGVSEDTIRRDLREMAAAGLCERVYGGALKAAEPRPYGERLAENRALKARFAAAIVERLPDGGLVFIDSGSTNLAVAEAIPADRQLAVVTNAPAIAATLMLMPNVEVIMTGGRVDRDLAAAVDSRALAALEGLKPDVFVMGTCGIDPARGIFADRWDEYLVKRAMASASARLIAAVEIAKVGNGAPYHIADFSPAITLVAEPALSDEDLSVLSAAGADIVRLEQEVSK